MIENNNKKQNNKAKSENSTHREETNLERIKSEISKFFTSWLKKGKSPGEIVHFLDILSQDLKMDESEVLKHLRELEKDEILKVISMGNFSPIKLTPRGWKQITGKQIEL